MFFTLLGLFVHIIFSVSIFDIYFQSPILHGIPSFPTPQPAPAKRLVLFVADGLRADKLFELGSDSISKAPFLRNIILSKGSWGISHTRVPTESRPGHVALIAGLYEDVSAVTRGWKENPVDFDSVFNQSDNTWAWGSPDILPIFTRKDENHQHIHLEMYSAKEEDFAEADPSKLDSWVFAQFEAFLAGAKENASLWEKLNGNRNVFFLHLLGLDMNGHAQKPRSQAYNDNIKLLDQEVEQCVQLVEQFFGSDGKTSYILTSDHGMTDWGSHGTGHPEETRTPLVAWGAGIRAPMGAGRHDNHDGLAEEWRLGAVKRSDINQADLAPLMAVLIGVNIPVNSVGILPVEYLGTDWSHRALSVLSNAQQVLAQFEMKRHQRRSNTLQPFFWQFKELSESKQLELMEMVESLLKQKRYKNMIQVCLKLTDLALKGFDYYQKYDRLPLCLSIGLSFLGWMWLVALKMVREHTSLLQFSLESQSPRKTKPGHSIVICAAGALFALAAVWLLHTQSSPFLYYCYFLLPIFLWTLVALRWDVYERAKEYVNEKHSLLQVLLVWLVSIVGLELLVAAFFYRQLLALVFVMLSCWPFLTHLRDTAKLLIGCWVLSCACMAAFLFLPVVGRDSNYSLVTMSGWLMVFIVAFCARRPALGLVRRNRTGVRREPTHVVMVTGVQVCILWLCTYVVRSTSESISAKAGLPIFCQVASWLVLVSSFLLPLMGSSMLLTRLLNVSASLAAPFLLMSIAHEGLFLIGFSLFLFLWLCLEHRLANVSTSLQDASFLSEWGLQRRKSSPLALKDCWRAYCFLFLVLYAFFGTGNIASLNSFEPSSVYCFLTVFSPFTMGFLMLVKVTIPFLLVSCFFRGVLVSIQAPPRALFLLVLLASDFMAFHFFFLVRDAGSWQEIGESISHYVIMMSTILLVMLLYGLAWLLTSLRPSFTLFKRHLQ